MCMQGVGTHMVTPMPWSPGSEVVRDILWMLILQRDIPPSQSVLCVLSVAE